MDFGIAFATGCGLEVQVDLVDQLGGWSLKSVGQGYGEGYPLSVCMRAIEKIA
jgi:hypothetical protein